MRYLSGLQELHSEANTLDIDIRDPLVIKTREDWKVYSANLVEEITLDSISVIPYTDLVALGRHPGVSGTIGVAYQSPEVLMAIQWKDFGSIHWKKGTLFSRSGSINYSGITVPDLLTIDQNVFNSIGDTLKKLASVDRSSISYRSPVRSSILAEFQYSPNGLWTLGSALQYFIDEGEWQVMSGLDFRVFPVWRLGSQLNYDSSKRVSFGLHTVLRLGAFNLFANTDHVQTIYPSNHTHQYSARMGISLMW